MTKFYHRACNIVIYYMTGCVAVAGDVRVQDDRLSDQVQPARISCTGIGQKLKSYMNFKIIQYVPEALPVYGIERIRVIGLHFC